LWKNLQKQKVNQKANSNQHSKPFQQQKKKHEKMKLKRWSQRKKYRL